MDDSHDYRNTVSKIQQSLNEQNVGLGYPFYTLGKRFARCWLTLPTQSATDINKWSPPHWVKLLLYPFFKKQIKSLKGFTDLECNIVCPPLYWMDNLKTTLNIPQGELPCRMILISRTKADVARHKLWTVRFAPLGVHVMVLDKTIAREITLPDGLAIHKQLKRE